MPETTTSHRQPPTSDTRALRTPTQVPRLSLLAMLCLAVSAAAGAPANTPAPVRLSAPAPQALKMSTGTQTELVFDKGVDRIAVADEAVASILLTRKAAGLPAARILVTAKGAGQTTLMVWEKGNAAATTYSVDVRRPAATLEGQFSSMPEQEAAREAALATNPGKVVVDRSVVDVRSHTVQVEVKVVEFSRNVLKQAGFSFSSYGPNSHGFSFGVTPATTLTSAFRVALGFNGTLGSKFTLDLLESNNLARVLAEPTLVALSGHSASFLAGGELPVPVSQGLGATGIEYKPFGIGLTVTPTVLSNDRIVLKVAPEASDLDYSNALAINNITVPTISTRRADTTVELGDGETFVIGGLVSRTTSSAVDKIPLLGDIPVIGTFFRQNRYKMNEKELVILVTPRLVKPIASNTDLSPFLPGAAEQRDGNVWGAILLGGASRSAVPGFSR